MGKGGFRPGAGRPRKPLEDKLRDGDLSIDAIKLPAAQNVDVIAEDTPEVREYMTELQHDGTQLEAKRELEDITEWVRKSGCINAVPNQLLEQYAMGRARWITLQKAISKFGYIAKKGENGKVQTSPFQLILFETEKANNSTLNMISQIVKENSIGIFKPFDENARKMAQLLDGD